ncbi:hypothetical protein GlitD10_2022 [Gloeomargarita lithophora Alchichica-D10]|uniref:ATP-binding protein n=1 Tax=Gloeomargarita lithophora Alchichica-D10 TaxID=1188229 RepID=A0A1J0AEI3_9CYAN|nr:BREX system ATP-binding domain-containing protein [Gloeomargarita lithophora]APB34348.1 hypothetical protein GlitD10_2022 [Gloeomargarita lithophora Alchichica-D10]
MNLDMATQIIESLRAGIPTRASTRNLQSMRNRLHEKFNDDLSQLSEGRGIPKGRLIWGKYGQGKTHELTCLEHLALDQGFAVSRITLNRQLSGQRLDHLYSKLATSIRTPQSRLLGIRHILDKKSSADLPNTLLQNLERYTHPLLAVILEIYFRTSGEEQELLYGALLGAQIPMAEIRKIYKRAIGRSFPPIPGSFVRSKHSHAYFEMMADILTWCEYQGWVILIDEIELIARLAKLGRMQAYHHLYWLLNWSGTQTLPIYVVGAVAEPLMDLWRNPQGRDRLTDKTRMCELAKERNNSYSEQAMLNFFAYGQDQQLCPFIEQTDRNQLKQLLAEIKEIHGISYGWQPEVDIDRVIAAIGNDPIRTHIRGLLETLDMVYLGDKDFVPRTATLTELSTQEDESYFGGEEV